MTREFTHKNVTFVTTVKFNTLVERTPNGRREHTVLVGVKKGSNLTGNKEYKATDLDLIEVIGKAEKNACDWVDDKNPTELEARLEKLGFTK